MCSTCEGQIILRTADGFEKIIKVPNCDITSYTTVIVDIHTPLFTNYTNTFPDIEMSNTRQREYRFRGYLSGGIRVLNEVLLQDTVRVSSKRNTEVLEQLVKVEDVDD